VKSSPVLAALVAPESMTNRLKVPGLAKPPVAAVISVGETTTTLEAGIAAHLRERRFELGLTQDEVAKAAGTSHSAVSRLEKGTHIPQLPTLQRIAAVLDEELLVCFQRTVDGEVEREFAAVA
jgi:DNA-binding XRE family transcriptional regulator